VRVKSISSRLLVSLALLLLAFGLLVGIIGRFVAHEHEQESLQRLSHGLAQHIVEHWPEVTESKSANQSAESGELAAREALLSMVMVVNPGIQIYILDARAKVTAFIGDASLVREPQVDLNTINQFLDGAALPIRGSDPMGSGELRIFSVAKFHPREIRAREPGYVYIVLDAQARQQVSASLGAQRATQAALIPISAAMLAVIGTGLFVFSHLTKPLQRLAKKMADYNQNARRRNTDPQVEKSIPQQDEVQSIQSAFEQMTARIEDQTERERRQIAAHKDMIASVAHDLRTPLTALHGHLEALGNPQTVGVNDRDTILRIALAQSNKVRHLSRQLFELAALQSTDQVLHREPFRLDELVADTVQKFQVQDANCRVTLAAPAPGQLVLEGDLSMIERALTNLIDNAVRHCPGVDPVSVSLSRHGQHARVTVQDSGPGLPAEIISRLEQRQSLREPPIKRAGGGIGGLGLAIAQRIAVLHKGNLVTLRSASGGTCLSLILPLVSK
jgi:signal transduction histidine kinase